MSSCIWMLKTFRTGIYIIHFYNANNINNLIYSTQRFKANEIAFTGIVPFGDQMFFGPTKLASNKNHFKIPKHAVM